MLNNDKAWWVTRLEKSGSPTINITTSGDGSDKLSKFTMNVWGSSK